jgi:NADP-dependent 3-hydroxy acid dehydrogenase YdfG
MERHKRVDLLVNNAGVALGGTFEQVSEDDFDWLMEINFHGVVRMTRAFLPHLRASDDGPHRQRVEHLRHLVSPPGQAAYSASKFAVRGFSNALRHELEGSRWRLGGASGRRRDLDREERARTGASRRTKSKNTAAQAHGKAAAPAAGKGRRDHRARHRTAPARILVGADALAIALLERFAPVRYWNLLKKAM